MQAAVAEAKENNTSSTKGEDTVVYEVGYHLLPTFEESDIEPIVSAYRNVVTKAGGAFIAEGAPQKIALSYPMAVWSNGVWIKHNNTYFGWLKFEIDPSEIAAIEEAFKGDKSVLRYLIVKTVREDTRANIRQFVLKEIRRGDSIKSTVKKAPASESKEEKVSDQKLDEVIEELTQE